MDYLDIEGAEGTDPQAVLGATLCMMSCTMQSGCQIYLTRIADYLEWLGALKSLDEKFRRLCRRLAAHWEAEAGALAKSNADVRSYVMVGMPSSLKH